MRIDFSTIEDTDRMVMFTDKAPEYLRGKKLPMVSGRLYYIRYDYKFNIETCELIEPNTPEYESSKALDINQLIAAGLLVYWHPYREFDIENIYPALCSVENGVEDQGFNVAFPKVLQRISELKAEFREHGFHVTTTAILHQLKSWIADCKCGYRDEKHGYHLFTPCSHNPFSLRVTELNPLCNWQTTYGMYD